MNYTFFTNSEKTWKTMFESISNAKNSIYLEMYIFQDDMEKFNFFSLLKEKAKQGLRVKLILDSFGSINLSKEEILKLKESGLEIIFISYLLHRMHRKVLITDEDTAYIGGVNFHQSTIFWNDLVVRIKGSLVKNIVGSFVKSYIDAGGKDPVLLKKHEEIISVKVKAWIVEHSPVKNNFTLKDIYKTHLNTAQRNIVLVTPYFMPRRWLSATLHQAVLRGVNVEILIPQNTDHFIIDRVNFFYMYKLSKLGVKFYVESEMNHAKAVIIDEEESIIGSQNLDFLSFDFNSEVGIFFKDPKVVSKLLAITAKWKINSYLFDYKKYKPKWSDYILSPVIKIFSKIF